MDITNSISRSRPQQTQLEMSSILPKKPSSENSIKSLSTYNDDMENGEDHPLIDRSYSKEKKSSTRVVSELEEIETKEKEKEKSIYFTPSLSSKSVIRSMSLKKWRQYLYVSLKEIFFGTKLNILMIFIPVSILAVHFKLSNGWIFLFSLLGIAPLAERLGFVTEQIALFTGPTMGGLLNATFGNATELIISIFALKRGLIRVVQMSLLGSILSNMLLVLGCAFFFGGIKYREQKFNRTAALVNSGLLLMAVMCLTFPAVLHATHTELEETNSEIRLSRFSSVIMLIAYACYLFFQLKTHTHIYCEEEGDDDDEEDEVILGFWGSIVWLTIITIFISLLSEYLVGAIEGASDSFNLPIAFISVIILPIVGNAAEHASAIIFAVKDKLDISLGVAIGSSTQISMFAVPFCVVIGWIMGVPMDLDFQLFETATLFITVLVVSALLQEGVSNYFLGIMLVFSYLIVAASFYVHQDFQENHFSPPPTHA